MAAMTLNAPSTPFMSRTRATDDPPSPLYVTPEKPKLGDVLLEQLTTAVTIMLENALYHPDLHPANVFLTDAEQLVIIDWDPCFKELTREHMLDGLKRGILADMALHDQLSSKERVAAMEEIIALFLNSSN